MILANWNENPRRAFAVEVVSRLREAGFEALWAGGCVRDLLLGLEPSDYDVATDARPDVVMTLFRRTVPVGVSFGVVRVIGPKVAGEVEVATFRSDGHYLDGRRPESVTFGSAELDASRRDFTINGMFLDPLSGEVLDYVGGREDLENKLLRAIGCAESRFAEDKLRLLRAVRFASRFDLTIEPNTRAAIEAMAPQVRQVSAERIAKELRVMLVSPSRSRAMKLAMETALLAAVLPDLKDLEKTYRGWTRDLQVNLWDHTLLVLENLPREAKFSLAMAALLHGMAMPWHVDSDIDFTIGDPCIFGREASERIARDLKLPNAERVRIGWLVESHAALQDPMSLRIAPLKKILSKPGIEDLLMLHRAIAMAMNEDVTHVKYCESYLRELPDGPIAPPPVLTGHDLHQLGWKPGPEFKRVLELAYDAQLEGRIASKESALAWIERAYPHA